VVKRGVSPRIVQARLVGSGGTTTITGPQLRRALGLDDSWISFSTDGSDPGPAPAPTNPVAGDPGTGGAGPG